MERVNPRRRSETAAGGEGIAIAALGFLAEDEERLERFLSLSGLTPLTLRKAAADPGFLVSVLDYVAADERLLVDLARSRSLPPDAVARALLALDPPATRRRMNAAATILCRDCLVAGPSPRGAFRCPHCRSPRGLDLESQRGLTIAHVDCDAFYASVEKRDDPSLRDVPLIVGGGGRRGVVSTACYIARTSGVRSAMPMAEARRLCPEAVVLPPRMTIYAAAAREIRGLMSSLTPLVEPLSIDEAFLDLEGCEAANGGEAGPALARFARRVEEEVGVTVSVGLADCKFLAKLASDLDKPRGFRVMPRETVLATLAPLDIGRIWGVGKVAHANLAAKGFRTIGDLQSIGETEATRRIGDGGRRLWRLARGIDERKVEVVREAKSVSSEQTFETDVRDRAELTRVLLAHCERVARRLAKQGLTARGVTLKLRRANFQLVTRARSGFTPTRLAPRFFATLRPLLDELADGRGYRLLGVGAQGLEEGAPSDAGDDLFRADIRKESAREAAIDAVREKFGNDALVRGLALKPPSDARRRR